MEESRLELLCRLVDRHAGALVLYARQWCNSADDVVQEALLAFASHREPPEHAVAWLYHAVRNRAISAARADQRRRRHEERAAGAAPAWFVPSEEDVLDAARAAQALEELPLEQREVLVARLWGGLNFEEIGRLAGCSSSAAHRRYQSGLEALRERLNVPCSNPNRSPKS